ncbi:hypothetical protein DPEC_G00287270 [Dallia pectoralis]|uniref:Uncharacterized protein n=1 Tax=Dallia pectoralis TaxID=75939 RepID=A0ACC2FK85_DALPE|nr:hypothetical protein DPEC_G00287270 [Dallia pectoralis]
MHCCVDGDPEVAASSDGRGPSVRPCLRYPVTKRSGSGDLVLWQLVQILIPPARPSICARLSFRTPQRHAAISMAGSVVH